MSDVVVDASALVDLLAGTERAAAVRRALEGASLHAPALVDIEVMSALGRLQRSGTLAVAQVDGAVAHLVRAPIQRYPLPPLLIGAWARRESLRLTGALYVELAEQTGYPLLTTDARLTRAWPAARGI